MNYIKNYINKEKKYNKTNKYKKENKEKLKKERKEKDELQILRSRANGTLYDVWTGSVCDNSKTHIGGAGYVMLKDDDVIKIANKGFLNTTSNRMELVAIISAMSSIPDNCDVLIHTDSQYSILVLNPINPEHKVKINLDLIELFEKSKQGVGNVYFEWVKGHNGTKYNEMANNIAFSASCGIKESK